MTYDPIAVRYSAKVNDHPWNRLYERPATLALLPDLKGLDALDAGCGNGFYSEYMLNAGARVTAYDLSAKMVDEARKCLGDRCDVFHCDAAGLKGFVSQKFDLVLSTLVMHYVQDLEGEFHNLAEFMKDDAVFVVSMHHPLLRLDRFRQVGYRKVEKVTAKWDWVNDTVTYFRRPFGVIAQAIHNAGLVIEQLVEADPLPEMAETNRGEFNRLMLYPGFVHFVLRRQTR